MMRQGLLQCCDAKDTMAIERVRLLSGGRSVTVAYSGGKDSTVLLDIVRRSGVEYRVLYYLTTADPPELVQHIRRQPGVVVDRPEHSIWWWMREKMIPPTHVARWCCEKMKHRDTPGSVVVTGIRWAESQRRSLRGMAEHHKGRRVINPIIDWSDVDVWQYIEDRHLPMCELYEEGWTRLGCVGCPLAVQRIRDAEFARWPKYLDSWRRAIMAAWHRRMERELETGESWSTPEAMAEWWISGAYRHRNDPGDHCLGMFDVE